MSNPHGRIAASFLAVVLCATAPVASQDSEAPAAAAAADNLVGPQIILKTQEVPVFPPAAKAGRFSGAVTVEAEVLKDGTVGEVKVLNCTRPKVGFEQASIDAVKQWRFEPGTKDGVPVDFSLKLRLNFAGGGPGESPRVSAGSFVSATKDGPSPSPRRDTSAAVTTPR